MLISHGFPLLQAGVKVTAVSCHPGGVAARRVDIKSKIHENPSKSSYDNGITSGYYDMYGMYGNCAGYAHWDVVELLIS